MNKTAILALAQAASALANAAVAMAASLAECPNVNTPVNPVTETPTPAAEPATPVAEKPKRGRPAKDAATVETPAAEVVVETKAAEPEPAKSAAPAGKTYEDMRALIQPLVVGGRGAEVKAVVAKYAVSLSQMDAKDYPAFEQDIEALSI